MQSPRQLGSPREPAYNFVARSISPIGFGGERGGGEDGGGGGSDGGGGASAPLASSSSSPPPRSPAAAFAPLPLSPSSGLSPAPPAALVSIAPRDVSKVEKAILPLVPTSDAAWLVFVLAAPHAAVFSVCDACLRRLADDVKYDVDALAALRPFRAILAAATRFPASRVVSDKAFKVLRRCATLGRAEGQDARRDAIMRAGAIEASVGALAAHGRDSKAVADNVCGLVQGLAMGSEDRKDLLAESTVLVRAIVAAMKTHNGLASAKSALWNVAVGSDERKGIVLRAGGAAAFEKPPADKEG